MPNFKILMADDDAEDQAIIKDTLAMLHAAEDIFFAQNGAEAVDLLENMYSTGQLPCLIVLDLNMPKLTGTQTLQVLKSDSRFSEIPVVIYSTSLNLLEKEKCLSMGAHSYITKPISFTESMETAKKFLEFCKNGIVR